MEQQYLYRRVEHWSRSNSLPWARFLKWTGDRNSKQQTIVIGMGTSNGNGSYLKRTDTCLNSHKTALPYFEWDDESNSWQLQQCLPPLPVGLPAPDWLARSGGVIMGQITGNSNFGLARDEVLNLIAAEVPGAGGELSIFWAWYLASEVGMLFAEGKYLNPLSRVLQLIDYSLFVIDAPIMPDDFANPCIGEGPEPEGSAKNACGHLTDLGSYRLKTPTHRSTCK